MTEGDPPPPNLESRRLPIKEWAEANRKEKLFAHIELARHTYNSVSI